MIHSDQIEEMVSDMASWRHASPLVRAKFSEWASELYEDKHEVRMCWCAFCSGLIIGQGLEYAHSKARETASYRSGYEDGKNAR